MTWFRVIGLSLLVGCAAAPAQEVVWRKSDPSPVTASHSPVTLGMPLTGREAVQPGQPGAFRKTRGQSPEDFILPPEFWPSTVGKDLPAKSSGKATDAAPPNVPVPVDPVPVDPAPAIFPEIPPERLNPWTGLPWGAVLGQINGSYHMVADWLIPAADEFRPPHRFSVEGEYLLWWTRGSNFPPLATTDSPLRPQDAIVPNPAAIQGGQGSLPIATVLFGGQQEARLQSGARFTATYWLGDHGDCAIEGDYFFLGGRSTRFSANSDQYPVIARPFINVLNGQEARELVSTPGIAPGDVFQQRGTITIDAPSRLTGFDLGIRKCLRSSECWDLQGLAGYRHLSLDEGLSIVEDIISLKTVGGDLDTNPGNRFIVQDSFNTENRFNGGYVGLRGQYRWNRFVIEGKTRLALGHTHQSVRIDGSQTLLPFNPPGPPSTVAGGLLAVPRANIGTFSQNRFGFVPEVGVKIGYQVTDNLRVHVGYDFLWWNSVLRPGEQVNRTINPFLVPRLIGNPPNPAPGPVAPRVPMQTTSYWATGFNFGAEFRY